MKKCSTKLKTPRSFGNMCVFSSQRFAKAIPYLLLAVAALSGIVPQPVVAALSVGIMFLMLTITNNVFLAYPVVLFYYIQLDLFLGVSVFRIFTLFLLVSLLLNRKKLILSDQLYILPLGVYILYLALTLSFHNLRVAAFFGLDLIIVFILIFTQLRDKDKLRAFFTVYVITALVAFFSGLIAGVELDSYIQSDGEAVGRLMATFNDPNYMGFFYSIAIFAAVTLGLFKKGWRTVVVLALYVMLFTSLSMTAIIGNILFWAVYLLAFRKMKPKTFLIVLAVAGAAVGLYFWGLSSPDLPILGSLTMRIHEKLALLTKNDLNSFSTNRFELTEKAWQFFVSQKSVFRILFGGHLANALIYDMPYGTMAAHNEYVDLLVNVGLIGAVILIAFALWRAVSFYAEWRKTKSPESAFGFLSKIIWLYYAATLTLFGEVRFLLFFFL